MSLLKETQRQGIGFMACAELNFYFFISVLREGFRHLAVKDEGGVGVEFFLKLEDLLLVAIPLPCFIHGENKHIAAPIVGKRVENSRVGDSHGALSSLSGHDGFWKSVKRSAGTSGIA